MPINNSRLPEFYRLSIQKRREEIAKRLQLEKQDALSIFSQGLSLEHANLMVENAVGILGLPIGIAANFVVDQEPVLVPMAIEEPSVVAAASHMAKLVALSGGFQTKVDDSIMIGQIQILDVLDMDAACYQIKHHREELIQVANRFCQGMKERGGGCVDIVPRILHANKNEFPAIKPMLVVHVHVDCCDAMGANVVNTVTEGLSPFLSALVKGQTGFCILSNLADKRLARAYCKIPYRVLSLDYGRDIAMRIVSGYHFACLDPYRAATHNKGILNGIDAVAIATGNDWRAIEAGAHAYACRLGAYSSLTKYDLDEESGALNCAIELPIAVGVKGGSTQLHPTVKTVLKILGPFGEHAKKLAGLMASVGLAQNLGALRALSSEGIQQGHMALHDRKNKTNRAFHEP